MITVICFKHISSRLLSNNCAFFPVQILVSHNVKGKWMDIAADVSEKMDIWSREKEDKRTGENYM